MLTRSLVDENTFVVPTPNVRSFLDHPDAVAGFVGSGRRSRRKWKALLDGLALEASARSADAVRRMLADTSGGQRFWVGYGKAMSEVCWAFRGVATDEKLLSGKRDALRFLEDRFSVMVSEWMSEMPFAREDSDLVEEGYRAGVRHYAVVVDRMLEVARG